MLGLNPLHPKESAILELLAEKRALSVDQLKWCIQQEKNITIPQPTLYRIVNKMLKHKMLVKKNQYFALNKVWVNQMQNYVNITTHHAQKKNPLFPPLDQGKSRIFLGNPFSEFMTLFFHLLLEYFSEEAADGIYFYAYHHAYFLLYSKQIKHIIDLFTQQKKVGYFLYGNCTVLDQYIYRLHQKITPNVFITSTPPFPKDIYTVAVCGDYFIEIMDPEPVQKALNHVFDTTKTMRHFDFSTLKKAFELKIPWELKLTRNKQRAQKLKSLFIKNLDND